MITASTKLKLKPGTGRQALVALMLASGVFRIQAAQITWSEPTAISNGINICTLWSLDRAGHFGSDAPAEVNGVVFTPMNSPAPGGDFPPPARISFGLSELAVADDQDGFFAVKTCFADAKSTLRSAEMQLLESAISDSGSAYALNLGGLTIGKLYLIQIWVNNSRNSSASVTFAAGQVSDAVHFNTTAVYGGTGQSILGMFVADDIQETISIGSEKGHPLINAFQLRTAPENVGLTLLKQPGNAANYPGKAVKLSVLAAGNARLTYQWQKMVAGGIRELYDNDKYGGTTNRTLFVNGLTAEDCGEYRVVVSDGTVPVSSSSARVSLLPSLPRQLVNVDINDGPSGTYQGDGILTGNSGLDIWNGLNGRNGFTNAALVDSSGATTPIRMTLSKPREDGFTRGDSENDLLRDYSPAGVQTVTLNELEPDCYYDVVVYSIGVAPNEGGIFSGAVEGIVHGSNPSSDFWASRFLPGTNCIRNPFAKSDARGELQFTIKATSVAFPDGYINGDLNGLQFMKLGTKAPVPAILSQPQPTAAYRNQRAMLTASVLARANDSVTYHWQKLSPNNVLNMADGPNVSGAASDQLIISNLTPSLAGNYRLIVANPSGSVTSAVASVSMIESPYLINVDIKNEADPVPVYTGRGVVNGLGGNFWNGINGRRSFENVTLADNEGNPTAVTLSLHKEQVDSYTSHRTANDLLKDYSVGHPQTVILKNLEPKTKYHLVVYSFGAMENEGGVFSGALKGVVRGWSGSPGTTANTFVKGTNYIENDAAATDANGVLTFTIQPTSTVVPNGFYNSDFNGLQVMRAE